MNGQTETSDQGMPKDLILLIMDMQSIKNRLRQFERK